MIQGTADVRDGKISEGEISKAVDFTYNAVNRNNPEERKVVLEKLTSGPAPDEQSKEWQDIEKDAFSTDESRVLKMVKGVFADYFSADAFFGFVANLERGRLGLVKSAPNQRASGDGDGKLQAAVDVVPVSAPLAAVA